MKKPIKKQKLQKKAQDGPQNFGFNTPLNPSTPTNLDKLTQRREVQHHQQPWEGTTFADFIFPFAASWFSWLAPYGLNYLTKGWYLNQRWDPVKNQWVQRPPSGSKVRDWSSGAARKTIGIVFNPWFLRAVYDRYFEKKKEYEEKLQFYKEMGIDLALTPPSFPKIFLEEAGKFLAAEGLAYLPQKGYNLAVKKTVERLEQFANPPQVIRRAGRRAISQTGRFVTSQIGNWAARQAGEHAITRAGRSIARILSRPLLQEAGSFARAAKYLRLATAADLFVPTPHSVLLAAGFEIADYFYTRYFEASSEKEFHGIRRRQVIEKMNNVADVVDTLKELGWYRGAWAALTVPFPSVALTASAFKELATGNWQKAGYLFNQAMTVAFPNWMLDASYTLLFGTSEYKRNMLKQHAMDQLGHMFVTGEHGIGNLAGAVSRIGDLYSSSSMASRGDALENLAKNWVDEVKPFSPVQRVLTALGRVISGGTIPELALVGLPSRTIISPIEAEKAISEAIRRGRYVEVIKENEHWGQIANRRLDLNRLIALSQRFDNAIELLSSEFVNRNLNRQTTKAEQLADKAIISVSRSLEQNPYAKLAAIGKLELDLRAELRSEVGKSDSKTLQEIIENVFNFSDLVLEEYKENISREQIDEKIKQERLRSADTIKEKLSERKKYFLSRAEQEGIGALTDFVFWLFDESKENGFSRILKDITHLSFDISPSHALSLDNLASGFMLGKVARYQAYRVASAMEGSTIIIDKDGKINSKAIEQISTRGIRFSSPQAQLNFNQEVALLQAKALREITNDVILDTLRNNIPSEDKAHRLLALASVYQVSEYDPIQVIAVHRLIHNLFDTIRADPDSPDAELADELISALVKSDDKKISDENKKQIRWAYAAPLHLTLRDEKGSSPKTFDSPIEGIHGGLATILDNINKNEDLKKIYEKTLAYVAAQLLGQIPDSPSEELVVEYIAAAMTVAALDGKINPQNVLYALNGKDANGHDVDLRGRRLRDLASDREFWRDISEGRSYAGRLSLLTVNFDIGKGENVNVLHIVSPEADSNDRLMRTLGYNDYQRFRSKFVAHTDDIKRFNLLVDQWRQKEHFLHTNAHRSDQLLSPQIRSIETFFRSLEYAIRKEEAVLSSLPNDPEQAPELVHSALYLAATARVNTLRTIQEKVRSIYLENKSWIERDREVAKNFNRIFAAVSVITAVDNYLNDDGQLAQFMKTLEDHFGLSSERPYSIIFSSRKAEELRSSLIFTAVADANSALVELMKRGSPEDRDRIAKLAGEMLSRTNHSLLTMEGVIGKHEPGQKYDSIDPYDSQFREGLFATLNLAKEMRNHRMKIPHRINQYLDLTLVVERSAGDSGKPRELTFSDVEKRLYDYNMRIHFLGEKITQLKLQGKDKDTEFQKLLTEFYYVRKEYLDFYGLLTDRVKQLEELTTKPNPNPGLPDFGKIDAKLRLAILKSIMDQYVYGFVVISKMGLRHPQTKTSPTTVAEQEQK